MEKVIERFLSYVKTDTQSDPHSETYPSTPTQRPFMETLASELKAIGVDKVTVDEYGYLMATVDAVGITENTPSIGFIAHVDTSSDMSGKNIKPRIVDYHGGDIALNEDTTLSVERFPELNLYKGCRLIVTDGTTLLGADDKAGVAEIMTAVERIITSGKPHGKICVAFTPDEEIGRGVDFFDTAAFGADYAYTMDGGRMGMVEYETFNAASARITVHGVNVHPGYAKGKMHNAIRLLSRFDSMLPDERPENTEGYEGFYHLTEIGGNVELAHADYIIRDHDRAIFERRKEIFVKTAESIANDEVKVTTEVKDQYYNMGEVLKGDNFHIVEQAVEAMRKIGVEPLITPVRGGTDGARLSFMGLPCPNLFAGGENFHGKYEFVSVEAMCKAVELIERIVFDAAGVE